MGVGTDGPEARERHVDQPLVLRTEVVGPDAEALDHTGAEVLHHHVGAGDEAVQDLAAGVGVHVDGDAALATIAHLVERAHAVDRHADVATDVAEARTLDLHDVGTLIGQERDRVRTGERDREVDDPDARDGTAGIDASAHFHAVTSASSAS